MDLVYFLQSSPSDKLVVRRSELPDYSGLKDVFVKTITGTEAVDLQVSYFVLPPNAPEERHVHLHAKGHEMVVVIEGSCFVDVEDETTQLDAGDMIGYASDVEHTIYTEDKGAVIVLISSPPYRGRIY